MTRQEHLDWAKKRALELVDLGDYNKALISIMSDLGKHPETKGHKGCELTAMLMLGGFLKTEIEVRNHINGFN